MSDNYRVVNQYYYGKEHTLKSAKYRFPQKLQSITITNTKYISSHAFFDMSFLKRITVNSQVEIIGDYAFYNCSGLTDFEAFNLKSIGSYTFYNCGNMSLIELNNSPLASVGANAFYGCDKEMAITLNMSIDNYVSISGKKNLVGEILLTDPTTEKEITELYVTSDIADYQYACLSDLSAVEVDGDDIYIGYLAFKNCKSLATLILPKNVYYIDNYAFYNTPKLTYIIYGGKKSDWELIEKGYDWNYDGNIITIHCVDGNISL